jgi:hypothetical protein
MHEVLWADAKWRPLSLVDVIDPAKVPLSAALCGLPHIRVLWKYITAGETHVQESYACGAP